jgi:hypothetical protein
MFGWIGARRWTGRGRAFGARLAEPRLLRRHRRYGSQICRASLRIDSASADGCRRCSGDKFMREIISIRARSTARAECGQSPRGSVWRRSCCQPRRAVGDQARDLLAFDASRIASASATLRAPSALRPIHLYHERGVTAERIIGHLRCAVIHLSIGPLICFVFLQAGMNEAGMHPCRGTDG